MIKYTGSVVHIALHDISKDIEDKFSHLGKRYIDENVVTPSKLYTKEQRTLNRQLGMSNINHLHRYQKWVF